MQPKKQEEIELIKRASDYYYYRNKSSKNLLSLLLSLCGRYNETYNDQVQKQVFTNDSFIKLRVLYTNDRGSIFYLAIHVESLHLFVVKYVNDISKFGHEVDFCVKHSHRCMAQFYGFVEVKGKKIGFVYEFLSNGVLPNYNTSNELFSLMTVIRILQVIEYLHSHSLIHRDLKPLNIILDHDNLPYVIDYETIRQPSDNEEMTGDVSSTNYMSPEQNITQNISYPTDIYSFGLIIYYLSEKKDVGFLKEKAEIPSISLGSKVFQDLYKRCVEYNPSKRPTYKDISSMLTNDFYLSKYIGNCLFKQKITKSEVRFTKEIDLIFKFINEIKFLKKPLSHSIAHFYIQQVNFLLLHNEMHKDLPLTFQLNYIAKKYCNGFFFSYKIMQWQEIYDIINNFYKIRDLFKQALNEKDYVSVIKYAKIMSKGEPFSFFLLGVAYEFGIGVKVDFSKAKEYYQLGAKEDVINCICSLGNVYFKGIGTPKDYLRAKQYYEEAIELGSLDAYNYLGFLYLKGFGVKQDFSKAKECYEIAAKQNNSSALYSLGNLYFNGDGVEKNYSTAKRYFEISAKLDNSDAYLKMAEIYRDGNGEKTNIQK